MKEKLYRSIRDYWYQNYGGRVQKVLLDAGFTCPNRLNASIQKKRVRPTASVSAGQLSQAILFPKGRRTLAREPSRVAA